MDDEKRCSFHNVALVEIRKGGWTCPIATLHNLADQFELMYEANYGPAPAGENGVYHHARLVLGTYGAAATS